MPPLKKMFQFAFDLGFEALQFKINSVTFEQCQYSTWRKKNEKLVTIVTTIVSQTRQLTRTC